MENLEQTVSEVVHGVLREKSVEAPFVQAEQRLVADLGLDSMDLAVIVATLEERTGTDPFAQRVAIASVHTVADLVRAYAA